MGLATPFGEFITAGVKSSLGSFSNTTDKALNGGSGNGSSSTEETEGEETNSPEVLQIEPGLYEAGAIALLEAGNEEQAASMIKTPWSEPVSSGAIVVNNGTVSVGDISSDDMYAKNEYGFYYGLRYDYYDYGFVFFEDGSFECYEEGEMASALPAGSAVYEVGIIDMSAVAWGILTVSSDGFKLVDEWGESEFTLKFQLNGDLIMPSDDNMTAVSEYGFSGQTSLTGVILSDGISSIGKCAFDSCPSLTNIEIPTSVTSIGSFAFFSCTNLETVTFGENSQLTTIDEFAFQYCENLKNIEIPASVTTLTFDIFSECANSTNIVVDTNNTNYQSADGVLFSKDMTNLIIYPMDKTDSSYSIPESVTTIGAFAFKLCTNLMSIEISESVTTIDSSAFVCCENLASITIQSDTLVTYGAWMFDGCFALTAIYVPADLVDDYQAASGWSDFASIIQAIQ